MTAPPLEDRLTRLADELVAPATPEIRTTIGRRAGVLRRRRRTRRAVGAGVLVLAAVAGLASVTRDTVPEAQTDWSSIHTSVLPALVLDTEGWEVVAAEDTTIALDDPASVQVFQVPGDPEGPRAVVLHSPASDPVMPDPDGRSDEVPVGDVNGYLEVRPDGTFVVRWSPVGDGHAEVVAAGLSREEALSFASALAPRDDSIQYPGTNDEFGFDVTVLPRGIEEVPTGDQTAPGRELVSERDGASVEVWVEATGTSGLATALAAATAQGPSWEVYFMGHPATFVDRADGSGWSVIWQPSEATAARIDVTGEDPPPLDDVLASVRTASDEEWATLVREHPV